MSLKSQVRDPKSPLGGFLRKEFPTGRNRLLLTEINGQLDSHPAICRLENGTPPSVHGLIGHAIDYRIRYHFAHTLSLKFAMARRGAWAVTRFDDLVNLVRSDPSSLFNYTITPLGDVPADDDEWQHFSDIKTEGGYHTLWRRPSSNPEECPSMFSNTFTIDSQGFAQARLPLACTLDFFDILDRFVDSISPYRRTLTSVEECQLARFCLILSVFESVGRSGQGWPPEFLDGEEPAEPESLLKAIPQAWVEDVAVLGSTFRHHHADWQGRSAILNPVFAGARDVGGADGDLIVDGCLWDIKTVMQKAGRKWLDQLLGYVLLDYEDEYAIGDVGLLFPRQVASVRWPLPELVHELSGRGDVSILGLRHKLRGLLGPHTSKISMRRTATRKAKS